MTNIIHKGFIDVKSKNLFKDTGLNNFDLATTKIYNGVKPMWQQLGFSNDDVQQRVVRDARSTPLAHRHRHQPVSERGGGGLPLMSCQRFDCLSEFDCPISSYKYCRSSAYRYAHGIA